MKRFLFILVLFGPCDVFSQKFNYSLQAGVNYPAISQVSQNPTLTTVQIPSASGYMSYTTNIGTVKETFAGNAGFFITGKIKRNIHNRISLASGLSLEYRRYNRSVVIDTSDELTPIDVIVIDPITGQPYGGIYGGMYMRDADGNIVLTPARQPASDQVQSLKKRGNTELLQVEIPILAGTHFFQEKLLVQLGFNVGYVLSASEYKQTHSLFSATVDIRREESSREFNRLTFGMNFVTTYRIAKKIGIQVSALRNLTPVYQNDSEVAGSAYLNSFSGGISYLIAN